MTAAPLSLCRESDSGFALWFWLFVLLSAGMHAAFLLRAGWERQSAPHAMVPSVMAVQIVEVRPLQKEAAVLPVPKPEQMIEEAVPVLNRPAESVATPSPTVEAKPAQKSAPPEIKRTTASAKPVPALVEARPSAIGNRLPGYPEMARRNKWQGLCTVRVAVTAQGRAGSVSLARSSGYGILDQAAIAAVKRWKFTPRIVRGVPAASTVEVPVNFSLR